MSGDTSRSNASVEESPFVMKMQDLELEVVLSLGSTSFLIFFLGIGLLVVMAKESDLETKIVAGISAAVFFVMAGGVAWIVCHFIGSLRKPRRGDYQLLQ